MDLTRSDIQSPSSLSFCSGSSYKVYLNLELDALKNRYSLDSMLDTVICDSAKVFVP